MRSRRKARAALIAAGGLLVGMVGHMAIAANTAGGSPTPANKAVAAGDTLKVFGPEAETTLLSAVLRTSKPTDLLLQTSLECSILTKLQTGPEANDPLGPPAKSTARASASIHGWIEIDDDATHDGSSDANERVVPVISTSQPPQDGSTPQSGDPAVDGATFCDRTYQRTVEDGETPRNGIDRETDYIDTKTANAFNWVLLNAGSGIHYVRLMADLANAPSGPCTRDTETSIGSGGSCTEAYVGNRTMIIEPTKMANDAEVAPVGS
jgi:hypothetical protein